MRLAFLRYCALFAAAGAALATGCAPGAPQSAIARPTAASQPPSTTSAEPPADLMGIKANASRVVYVLDADVSIRSNELWVDVLLSIERLKPAQRFNVLFFGSAPLGLGDALVPATLANKQKATGLIFRTTPRPTMDPVRIIGLALAMKPQVVWFVVDPGDFPDNRAVIDAFKKLNTEHAVVNTISTAGHDESGDKVLQEIARDGHGVFRRIQLNDLFEEGQR